MQLQLVRFELLATLNATVSKQTLRFYHIFLPFDSDPKQFVQINPQISAYLHDTTQNCAETTKDASIALVLELLDQVAEAV